MCQTRYLWIVIVLPTLSKVYITLLIITNLYPTVKKSKSSSYSSNIKTKVSAIIIMKNEHKRIKERLPKRAQLRHITLVLKNGLLDSRRGFE